MHPPYNTVHNNCPPCAALVIGDVQEPTPLTSNTSCLVGCCFPGALRQYWDAEWHSWEILLLSTLPCGNFNSLLARFSLLCAI